MSNDATPLRLTLTGAPIKNPPVPDLLRAAPTRRDSGVVDPLLPDDYLKVVHAYDLGSAARSTAAGQRAVEIDVTAGQLVVLELPDGTTLITSGEHFRRDLERAAPEAVTDGRVVLDDVAPRGAASRGIKETLGRFVSRIFVLDRKAVADAILEEALDRLRDTAKEAIVDRVRDLGDWSASRLAMRALMWAIEKRLPTEEGLYHWSSGRIAADGLRRAEDPRLAQEVQRGRCLVFIHGTGSHTAGAFGDLRVVAEEAQLDWDELVKRYEGRIYGFEHRSLSRSPIENAILLARTLPDDATVDLVSHSRGGLVGDLLALDWSDEAQVERRIVAFRRFRERHNKDVKDFDEADEEDRAALRTLATIARGKRLTIGRYVRVASPSNGTLLAGANLDMFLSGFLTVLGTVTTLQASPFYIAFKRAVLEIIRHRADARIVPGLEAMLPGSALSRFLRLSTPRTGVELGVIAGDIQGSARFKRLVEFLADWAVFSRTENDLVVDTASMDAGIAASARGYRLLSQGPLVDHVSYFSNAESRRAMALWLTSADVSKVSGFQPLPRPFVDAARPPKARTGRAGARGTAETRPVVFVLPGVMGTHLAVGQTRIWFDPLHIANGRFSDLALDASARVTPERLFDMFYGDLCEALGADHDVRPFPYDWRLSVVDAAKRFSGELRLALNQTKAAKQPVRIVAHSMGGLVVRAAAALDGDLWDEFLDRDGARFIMLGTPNQGSHQMVATLLGKGDMVRKLAMLDVSHDLQWLLDKVKAFPGALQLLPRPGFQDVGDAWKTNYHDPAEWVKLKELVTDFWFGDRIAAVPGEETLNAVRELWTLAGFEADKPSIPGDHADKVIYVCGSAPNTPCGLTAREVNQGREGPLKLVGTPEGDGTVTWRSGLIEGIGASYQMDAAHGDLASTTGHFGALRELLVVGKTEQLPKATLEAARRDGARAATVVYDAPPAAVPTDLELAQSILGGGSGGRTGETVAQTGVLHVGCAAMDLRYATAPILVGHYQQDPIAGAEGVIDRDVVGGELTWRNHLGLYAGAVGTATAVLVDENDQELARGTRRGAVVTGLGEYGSLTVGSLTESVRVAALRYLLTVAERSGAVDDDGTATETKEEAPRGLALSSLLLGHNSTTNISVGDSVHAIVRGVLEANRQFARAKRRGPLYRIERLEIIEQYLDVAITAARALRAVESHFDADAADLGMRVKAAAALRSGEGVRPRLDVQAGMGYWPRLSVTQTIDSTHAPDAAAPPPADAGARGQGAAAGDGKEGRKKNRARVATSLKYVYLGQRARAEMVEAVRQPGLVERLVAMSVRQPSYNPELANTLFQLMVPLDFKEVARQMDSMLLVLDELTANFPWELLASGGQPLVRRTKVVRQFVTGGWRRRVRSTVDRTAYIVGNPSTAEFRRFFPDPSSRDEGRGDLPNLPGAEQEAYAVSRLLRTAGYETNEAIGRDQVAVDVITRLFQRPYRIVHVAAHGEFDIEAADGSRRSGVILSNGLMLTPAEIEQMEIVPDLVFLNCCHLGVVDDTEVRRDVAYNRLASSLARQLIEMGVRAVVVAGWAVDDAAGKLFAETFYQALLVEGTQFGEAVHLARQATYRAFSGSTTWGAFQAYGDPSFVMDPARGAASGSQRGASYVDPHELLDALEQLRESLRRPGGRARSKTLAALQRDVEGLLARSPEAWATRGDVRYRLGMLFAEFGEEGFPLAIDSFQQAVAREERAEWVPIKAIEQLANMEGRWGEKLQEGDAVPDEATVRRASIRLLRLADALSPEGKLGPEPLTPERCALLGSAYKRLAAVQARSGGDFTEALLESATWYERGMGAKDGESFHAYCAINVAWIQALQGGEGEGSDLARRVAGEARARFANSRQYWDALLPADARLALALTGRQLDAVFAPGNVVDRELDEIADGYRQARSSVIELDKSWDSIITQIELLKVFARPLGRAELADNLALLLERLGRGNRARHGAGSPPERRASVNTTPGAAPEETPAAEAPPAAQTSVDTTKSRARRKRSRRREQ